MAPLPLETRPDLDPELESRLAVRMPHAFIILRGITMTPVSSYATQAPVDADSLLQRVLVFTRTTVYAVLLDSCVWIQFYTEIGREPGSPDDADRVPAIAPAIVREWYPYAELLKETTGFKLRIMTLQARPIRWFAAHGEEFANGVLPEEKLRQVLEEADTERKAMGEKGFTYGLNVAEG